MSSEAGGGGLGGAGKWAPDHVPELLQSLLPSPMGDLSASIHKSQCAENLSKSGLLNELSDTHLGRSS